MVGFSSPAYGVIEGEEVEVSVEMKGETDIDVIVHVATQDSTADGEEIESFGCIRCDGIHSLSHSLSPSLSLPPQLLRTISVLAGPLLSPIPSQFTTSPSIQLTTTVLKGMSPFNSSSLSLDHPSMESYSLTPSSPM
jgi:hypothetical protein